MSEDIHLKVLRLVADNSQLTQRELAEALGISLGKANYCLHALLEKGWVKVNNFRNSHNKLAYSYLLTPRGLKAKSNLTVQFLGRKMAEFDALKLEIAELRKDVNRLNTEKPAP